VSGQFNAMLTVHLWNMCLVPSVPEIGSASLLMKIVCSEKNVLNPSSHDFLVPQTLVMLLTELLNWEMDIELDGLIVYLGSRTRWEDDQRNTLQFIGIQGWSR
jgi:hypothetical protein